MSKDNMCESLWYDGLLHTQLWRGIIFWCGRLYSYPTRLWKVKLYLVSDRFFLPRWQLQCDVMTHIQHDASTYMAILKEHHIIQVGPHHTIPHLWNDWCHTVGGIVEYCRYLVLGLANWCCRVAGVVLLKAPIFWRLLLRWGSFGCHCQQRNLVGFPSPTYASGRGAPLPLNI